MRKRQSIPFVILLVFFLLWLYLRPEEDVEQKTKLPLNYIIYDASSTHFNESGKLEYEVFSSKTTGFSEQDLSVFEKIKLILYIENKEKKESTVWQVTSDEGILYKQNKLILSKNVVIKNLSQDQLIQTMTTEKLTILLDTKEISTDQLVTWHGPQMQQQGIGMWASLVTEELIVKDKIEATYFNENK